MICSPVSCGCSFESVGLQLSVGSEGQIIIEPAGPGIVALKSDVATPFLGQTIIETSTGRFYRYDGTNWVISGGSMPGVSLLGAPQSAANTPTVNAFVLGTEIFDTDGFHSGTNGFVTIPAGMGGIYMATAGVQYDANATGYRATRLTVGNNTGVTPAEPVTLSDGGDQIVNTANNGTAIAKPFRLRAAATLTAATIQSSGGALNTVQSFLTLLMWRHEPGLI